MEEWEIMDLNNKKLLLMGGAAFSQDLKKYALEKGFQMIAVGQDIRKLEKIADEAYQINTQDVDALEKLVKEKGIDGIFVGTTEVNIPPAMELSRRTGAHFYVNQAQWDILANKRAFKDLLERHGISAIPEYNVSSRLTDEEIGGLPYPVLVKPADSSGARGISLAENPEELRRAYAYAESFSPSGTVLVERFMRDMDDTFIRYHFQDGKYSVSSSFDRHVNFTQGGFGGVGIAYLHPSSHLQKYLDDIDEKMQAVFREMELKDGVITLQGFVDGDEQFHFYEAGYRLGGSQSYIFTDAVNGSNSLHYMINYALTGKMADEEIARRDNPYFTKACCNLYVALKAGTITKLDGVEAVRAMPEVLNVTELIGVGETIEKTGSLSQVCLRMHVIAENWEKLNGALRRIYDTLCILDENGNDMILERFQRKEK